MGNDTIEVAYPRKYRPKSLSDYMGVSIRDRIRNRLKSEKNYPQTFLLHGTRGCGKTTLARLIAKEYLCLNKTDGHACGECEMCQEIDNNLIDSEFGAEVQGVTEVNIATDGGKKDIESLMESAYDEPMYPIKYSIFILDEVHKMTSAAQNALLKLLEEPPKYLVFILCTTDPEGLLDTVRDRCQLKLQVKKADLNELVQRLLTICQVEGLRTNMEALKMIATKCNKNPRESMMLLETVAKNHNGDVTIENVLLETGSIKSEIYINFYKAATKGLESILLFTNDLKSNDIEYKDFIKGLTEFTMQCINIKYGIGMEEYDKEFIKQVKQFFNTYNTEDLDCLLQILEYANKMVNTNVTMAELVVNTTAMRISKIKLLAVGLQNEQEQAILENQRGEKKYIDEHKKEEQQPKEAEKKELNSALMQATFGKSVVEVKGGIKIGVTEDDEKDIDDKGMSDEEFMDFVKQFENI